MGLNIDGRALQRSVTSMRARLVLSLLLAPLPAVAAAQSIHGTVKDQATGRAIVAASVELVAGKGKVLDKVLTDSLGAFLLEPDEPGAYALKASGLGYRDAVSASIPVRYGELVEVTLELAVDAVPLQPLTVEARSFPPNRYLADAGFYDRRRAGVGVFLTREDIMKRRPEEFSDLMRTIAGMEVRPSGVGGRRGYTLSMRTNGQCQPVLVLDGVPTLIGGQPPLRRGLDIPIDDVVAPRDIEGLELYKGAAGVPSEYNVNNAACGVLLVWTRRK